MRSSPVAFALIDPTTHIYVDANDHYAALFGLRASELKGKSIFDVYDPETAKAIVSLHDAFARGTIETVRGQGQGRLVDGRVIERRGWERRIEGISEGPMVVTTSVDATTNDTVVDDQQWVARAPHLFGPTRGDSSATPEQVFGDRAEQLQQHLFRIDLELRAAGLRPALAPTHNPDLARRVAELSERQREIVSRLLVGERVPEIARAIFLSANTVRNHLTAVFRKFGVHSQVELLAALNSQSESPGPDRIDAAHQTKAPLA
jgi:PAS domain S-box-containing protein